MTVANYVSLTKADTLASLAGRLKHASILPQFTLTFSQWQHDAEQRVADILTLFQQPVAVRSSAKNEDTTTQSNAGKYSSVLNVAADAAALQQAIAQVFSSYDGAQADDQVFIQPMISDADYAGVAFSHDASTGAPYYVISADLTGDTQTVTAGADAQTQTWYIRHDSKPEQLWLAQLVDLLQELALLYPGQALDLEFVFRSNQLILLQLRPLIINNTLDFEATQYQTELHCIDKKLHRLTQRHPYLLGEQTCFGVMPDWNPAEIIGMKPRPLALSLYKELITDAIWATQRCNYGYRDVRDHALLIVLGGTPYIDIRVSFNSFIPASLDTALAEKLVNFYLNKLKQAPQLHDKVEFAIVASCFAFDLDDKLTELAAHNFTKKECEQIRSALIELTKNIIADNEGVFAKDIASIAQLEHRQKQLIASDLNKLDKIYWLIQDCKRYGTLPFAGLARAGFIAMQLLASLKHKQLLTDDNYQAFLRDVRTVSSSLVHDKQHLPAPEFFAQYGHLRPGTYEITSYRYDEQPEKYFAIADESNAGNSAATGFSLSLQQLNAINQVLADAKMELDAVALFNFIKQAIEAREYSKFVFTRSLSDALVLIEQLGQQVGFSREQLAFADIKDILRLHSTTHSAAATLQSSIALGQNYYRLCQSIKLPALISSAHQARYFALLADEPNFITTKRVSAACTSANQSGNLAGKIVFIEAADPGYDWLFSHGIAGLITQYGGCNSHMAIRAQELGIPAIIGAGELLYNKWRTAKWLTIDCASKKVEPSQ